MNGLQTFLFGIYPYIAMVVFLVGSLWRFDREQYSWKIDSSELLRRGQLRWGNNLFHVGILLLFVGHLFGLLTPPAAYHALGLSTEGKQVLAMAAGGLFGSMCLVGLILLVHRRLVEPRIRATSTPMDLFILFWILITLLLGLTSIFVSMGHPDGAQMILLASWAQHLVTFRAGAADFLVGTHPIFRVHLVFGITLFLLFPFSRLVHVWSGFGSVAYLFRPHQITRPR